MPAYICTFERKSDFQDIGSEQKTNKFCRTVHNFKQFKSKGHADQFDNRESTQWLNSVSGDLG